MLTVQFVNPEGAHESREYNLRVSDGRKGFIHFAKWAMFQNIRFTCFTSP